MLCLPEVASRVNHARDAFVLPDGTMTVQWYNAMREAGYVVVWCDLDLTWHSINYPLCSKYDRS